MRQCKRRILFLFAFFIFNFAFAASAHAAVYTVKAGGGGDFTTIQACASALSNGDTCVVYAGTYNEHVSLSAGGVGAYKTLQVNGTDLVYVSDFVIQSHNKLIGFNIQNPSSPNSHDCIGIANTATDISISSNVFYACGSHAMISGVTAAATSTYVYIQNNTFSYPCSISSPPNACKALNINGDDHLIENNDLSHTSDGMSLSGSHNIIRKNTFHDNTTSDCGSNSGNCHIDFIESEPNVPTQYNVYEENTELNNLGSNGHGFLAQANVCNGQCYNLIIRFNRGAHVGSGGILDDNAFDNTDPGFHHVKSYNNSWVDFNNDPGNQLYGGTNGFTNNSTYGAEINDLFYYPESLVNFNPYLTDSSTVGTFSVSHNLAYCTALPCNLHGHVYGSGSFTDDPGNQVANPTFANYAGNDFHLAAGSPAIGAGTSLTTVAAGDTGLGTSLVVNDAGFFQDGYGIPGVQPDWIAVGTVGNVAQISAINYATNVLTLATPLTRQVGDPVYLFKDSNGRQVLYGSAPDIGAYPYCTGNGCNSRVAVSLSPTAVTLLSGTTQQFIASVTGSTNTAVTWSATLGTISSTGLYTAPVVSGNTLDTVTATSVADPTMSAQAAVTVTSGSGSGNGLPAPRLNLPNPAVIEVNAQIAASESAQYNIQTYNWTLTPVAQGNGDRPHVDMGPVPSLSSSINSHAASASFSTHGGTANLAPYALIPGYYLVSVTATDSSGTSPAAQAYVTLVPGDLSGINVYPNPWRSDRGYTSQITFSGLPVNTTIKIFTVSGHWVKSLPTASGAATWDLTNDSGDKVASGIYFYLITAEGGQKSTGKLAIIR